MNRLPQNPQADGTATKKRSTILASNPVMRRLEKVDEFSETNSATYGGITFKTVYFLLMTIVGIVLQLFLAKTFATGNAIPLQYKGFTYEVTTTEVIVLGVVAVLAIVFQLLAFFVKGSTPVTGALYCVTQGYFISFLIFRVLEGKEYIGALALALTMLIILVMSILYTTGVIKVTKKFRMVMMTLFVSMVSISLLTFIGYLVGFAVPAVGTFVSTIMGNFWVSIAFSVIFIIIASLFLVSDFAVIQNTVENKRPKKYEWQAAFGLSFTVLWLYLKVLQLLITIFGRGKN